MHEIGLFETCMNGALLEDIYYRGIFQTFAAAAKWQREKVEHECVINKYVIHSTGIMPEVDYETGRLLFKAHLRLFPNVAKELPELV